MLALSHYVIREKMIVSSFTKTISVILLNLMLHLITPHYI